MHRCYREMLRIVLEHVILSGVVYTLCEMFHVNSSQSTLVQGVH